MTPQLLLFLSIIAYAAATVAAIGLLINIFKHLFTPQQMFMGIVFRVSRTKQILKWLAVLVLAVAFIVAF